MPSSYPGQRTRSRAAHQKRENLRRKNTRSCPLCSCTLEDTSRTPHTHPRLFPNAEDVRKEENSNVKNNCDVTVEMDSVNDEWLTDVTFTFTGVLFCQSRLEAVPAQTEDASLRQVSAVMFTDVVTARVPTAMVWPEQKHTRCQTRQSRN